MRATARFSAAVLWPTAGLLQDCSRESFRGCRAGRRGCFTSARSTLITLLLPEYLGLKGVRLQTAAAWREKVLPYFLSQKRYILTVAAAPAKWLMFAFAVFNGPWAPMNLHLWGVVLDQMRAKATILLREKNSHRRHVIFENWMKDSDRKKVLEKWVVSERFCAAKNWELCLMPVRRKQHRNS